MRELRVAGHYLSFPLLMLSLIDCFAIGVLWYLLFAAGGSATATPWIWATVVLGAASGFVANAAVGLYHIQLRARLAGILGRAGVAFLLGLPAALVAALVLSLGWSRVFLALGIGAMAYGVLGLLHAAFFALADAGWLRRRVLVLGDEATAKLSQLRRRADQRGFEVAGYLSRGESAAAMVGGTPLCDYARRLRADEIVVALSDRRGTLPMGELMNCRLGGVSVVDLATFVERESGKVRLDLLHPGRIVFEANRIGVVAMAGKRLLDLLGAVLLLLLTLPVTLLTILAIKREEGWRAPLFYRQVRVGKDGIHFEVMKFRSMRLDAEADGKPRWATKDDERITRVGRVIRKLRIDELPQLLNVLRGQMSLVGPRPERPAFVAELEQHIPYYALRHRIKPGVTGWAQLLYPYGSSRADAAEKLQFDLYYLKNRSLMLDVIILLQTVEVVLFGKGAR